MKKKYLLSVLTTFTVFLSFAQTFVSTSTPQQITSYNQLFTFSFDTAPVGGWGSGTLVVYFVGDFGDNSEYITVFDEDLNNVGQAGPYSSYSDCSPLDSVYLNFDASLVDGWLSNNQIDFNLVISGAVDLGVCMTNYIQCKLIYNYCAAGQPQELANFTLANDVFCTSDSPVNLIGTPVNGTFSGNGVVDNTFNPGFLNPATTHTITYTATDGIGCVTTMSKSIKILKAPTTTTNLAVCPDSPAELMVTSYGDHVWFTDNNLTSVIDTGNIIFSQPLTETTNFYVAQLLNEYSFEIDSISVYDSLVVDIFATAGDDRGGIAITPDYVYSVGDNFTVRANASDLSNQTSLPKRDGIFSDLATGKLFTFWNTTTNSAPNYDQDWQFTFDAIREMDEDLNFGAIYLLETPIYTEDYALVLAGKGFVGLASYYPSGNLHIINLNDFSVQNLGQIYTEHYGSENWADWGVLEYDGTDFYGLYRNWNYAIVRHNFTTDEITAFVDFTNDNTISDLSSFTISPWNNRWYFHYEGSTTLFGGVDEALGYATAGSHSSLLSNNGLGCYSEVTVTVNQIDLGEDITACENHSPVVLFAGNGFTSYTWNGANNDYNAFPVTESGTYIVVAVDNNNCSITDTINVLFDPCLGLESNDAELNVSLFPNPTTNRATVQINALTTTEMHLFVTDLNGKILFEENAMMTSGYNSIDLNVSHLNTGVYLLNLTGNEGSKIIRFVKQ